MSVQLVPGNCPVILSVPHDGQVVLEGSPMLAEAVRWKQESGKVWRDEKTLDLALACSRFMKRSGVTPSVLWFDVDRAYVDVNRSPDREPFMEGFGESYRAFHEALDGAIWQTLSRFGICLLVDIHGYAQPCGPDTYDIVAGSDSHKTSPRGVDRRLVESLRSTYKTVFSPDPRLGVRSIFRGGWIVRRTASKFSSFGLDAVQLEFNAHLRRDPALSEAASALAQALISILLL